MANIKHITEINERIVAWWPTKGVPIEGYAKSICLKNKQMKKFALIR